MIEHLGGAVRTIRLEMILGALVTVALLGVLSVAAGLDLAGWLFGLATGWGITGLLAAGRARGDHPMIYPPDWVTLGRGLLIAGIAGLVADPFDQARSLTAFLALISVALALDAVDGQVARRTGTATPIGARFDGEVDAFLILLLSIAVSRDYGAWVLAIGAARYVLLVAGWVVPWLAAPLPPRSWRRVVAAVQGVVLTVAVSAVLPRPLGMFAVAGALVLLAESFGRDVAWLYRAGAGQRARRTLSWITTGLAIVIVWTALVAPDRLDKLRPVAFLSIPVEGLVLVGFGLFLPPRPRRILAAAAGFLFGLLTVVKILDIGFYEELGRPFDPVLDWGNLTPAIGVVRDSIGPTATDVVLVLAGLAVVMIIAVVTVSTIRTSSATAGRRRASAHAVAALSVVWAVSAALSLQLASGAALASRSTAGLALAQVRDARSAIRDQQRFEQIIHAADPYKAVPTSNLLAGLRGKDVVIAFVESYGQVAVQGTTFSGGVDTVLRAGNATLTAAGYSARSAFLDSPTFGGISWLAHSTLQSGLWVDNQQRYNQLLASNRLTLTNAFKKAGWRTVSDIPSDEYSWPQGTSFYAYDQLYDRRNVGYRGPRFSYASMPDQYCLAAFQRLELTVGHGPVMAEIDLVSSHTPWTPLPRIVPWDQVGDGSVYDPMPAQGLSPAVAWSNTDTVRRLYGQSVQYSLQALISWVVQLHDDNLVLVLLGDHQPATTVSGPAANHLVPISIIAHDSQVLDPIASWRWQTGLLPSVTAPMWPMDAFRNRFLDAYSISPPGVAVSAPP